MIKIYSIEIHPVLSLTGVMCINLFLFILGILFLMMLLLCLIFKFIKAALLILAAEVVILDDDQVFATSCNG